MRRRLKNGVGYSYGNYVSVIFSGLEWLEVSICYLTLIAAV